MADTDASDTGEYDRYTAGAVTLILIHFLVTLLFTVLFREPVSALLGLSEPAVFMLIIYIFGAAVLSCWYADTSLRFDYARYLLVYALFCIGAPIAGVLMILFVFPQMPAFGRMCGIALVIGLLSLGIAVSFYKRAAGAGTETRGKRLLQTPENRALQDTEGAASGRGRLLKNLRWGIRYSLPTIPGGLSQFVLSEFDRIMVLRILGETFTGIYTLAFQVFVIGNLMMQIMETVWIPWMYERLKSGERAGVKTITRHLVILAALIFALMLLLSPEMILILGGARYGGAIVCVLPLLCGGFYVFLSVFFTTVEFYHEKTGWNAAVSVAAALCNVVLNAVVIPRFSIAGAAWTTAASYLVYLCLHYLLAAKLEKKESLFPMGTIAGMCLAVPAFAFLCAFVKDWLLVRFAVTLVVGVFALYYEEKTLKILQRIKKRRTLS